MDFFLEIIQLAGIILLAIALRVKRDIRHLPDVKPSEKNTQEITDAKVDFTTLRARK
jgi:hypothetical protein